MLKIEIPIQLLLKHRRRESGQKVPTLLAHPVHTHPHFTETEAGKRPKMFRTCTPPFYPIEAGKRPKMFLSRTKKKRASRSMAWPLG